MIRRLTLTVLLVLCAGCTDLQTEYGDRTLGSINGLRVLYASFDEAFTLRELSRLGKRTDELDLLVHVAGYQGLPEEEGLTWIEDWLEQQPRRQAVIILRDGTMTSWLCRRWVDELRTELATAPEARREVLKQQIERLLERAQFDSDPEFPFFIAEQSVGPLRIATEPMSKPQRVHGLLEAEAPPFLDLRYVIDAENSTTLIGVDERAWALAVPYGSSRLIVVSSAQPLLDAAQVDPTSRRMLAALRSDLLAFTDGDQAAWVRSLAVGPESDPPPPNILAMLFGRPPFSYVVVHLLVLVIAFLALRALWLGRTEPAPGGDLQRFRRHVEAFAVHLRRAGATREVLAALASVLRRKSSGSSAASASTSLPTNDGDAFTAARALYVDPEQGPPHA